MDYTPTTWHVRHGYVANSSEMRSDEKLYEEFDRWFAEVKADVIRQYLISDSRTEYDRMLAEVKAEAYENATRALTIGPAELLEIRAEAWEEGTLACLDTHHLPVEDSKLPRNPYRQGEEHTHTKRSSFGDPYCKTCGIDLEGETE